MILTQEEQKMQIHEEKMLQDRIMQNKIEISQLQKKLRQAENGNFQIYGAGQRLPHPAYFPPPETYIYK